MAEMIKIRTIAQKEWAEVFKNRFVLFTVAFLPLIMTALPLIVLYGMRTFDGFSDVSTADLPAEFISLCGDMNGAECSQYFVVSQFMLLFMLLPLAIPVTIASYSIVGEKATRTLEPVLATPVSTLELLSGKAIAAVVPAVLATWLGFTIFALGTMLISESVKITGRLLDPVWLIAVFVLGPLLAIAAVNVAVMVSSRATDPRVAEQLSMLVVLPLLAVFFGQVTGLILINETVILWMTLAMIVVDTVTFLIAVRLFQRESILTRWK